MMFVLEINGITIPNDIPPQDQYTIFDLDDLPDDGEGIGDNELWFISYINMCVESCKALPLLTNIVRIGDNKNPSHLTYIHISYLATNGYWQLSYMDHSDKNPFGWAEKIFHTKKGIFEFLLKGGVWNG